MHDINLPDKHRTPHRHRHKANRQVQQQELPRPHVDALLLKNLAPEEARERRGERERERAEVRAERERVDRPVARPRVDSAWPSAGRGEPELEDACEEDRRADVRPTELLVHIYTGI